jgi:gamma-glutamylcyclotransferase (GGCT)/AIG2-like uncharacterized protein YtfP
MSLKPKNVKMPTEYLDVAYDVKNKDGCGLFYHDGTSIQVFKTLDYDEFKTELAKLDKFEVVVHLRAATVGAITLDNCHPFSVSSSNDSVYAHNGTIFSLKPSYNAMECDDSDTKAFADLLKACNYDKVSDLAPFIQHTIGETINRLVFMDPNGAITIFNRDLGIEEPNNIWCSNDYHVAPNLTKVFVYGTLKKGLGNHHHLTYSNLLGRATTTEPYYLYGTGRPFPYLLGEASKIPSIEAPGHLVEGEVYEVTDGVLTGLDRLEGVPHHYVKHQVSVNLNGKVEQVATYIKASIEAFDEQQTFISNWSPTPTPTYVPLFETDEETLIRLCDYDLVANDLDLTYSEFQLQRMYRDCYVCYYGIQPDYLTYRALTKSDLIMSIVCIEDFILDDIVSLTQI